MTAQRTPVLIAGGGAAGLALSTLLSLRGIESLLVERRAQSSDLPKAHILHQRTMEIFEEIGIAEEAYAEGSPLEWMSRVTWMTSLAGPTPEHGRVIGSIDSWGGGERLAFHLLASPCRATNLSQRWIEPMLRRRAQELAPDGVRFGHELVDLSQGPDSVLATIRDEAGETYTVESEFLVGTDGGRTVPGLVGIGHEGEGGVAQIVSSYIRTDLSGVDMDPRVSMYFFINPDAGGSIRSGALVKMGGREWGALSDEFVYHFAADPGPDREYPTEEIIERFHRSIGKDAPVEILRSTIWHIETEIAERFSEGRVFLAGDSAHRHPPSGALGLNSAIHDVHNLAWKLAAVLRGEAGVGLLESYGAERRPAVLANANQSMKNFYEQLALDQAIGIVPGESAEEGWAAFRTLFSEGSEGDAKRALVDEAIAAKRREYQAQNLELGVDYEAGALIPDEGPVPTLEDPVTDFIPGTWPGHRMPHARLVKDGRSSSTYALARNGRFALFVSSAGSAWRAGASAAAERLGIELDVIGVGPGAEYADPTGAWNRQREVTDEGAVLVRPDQRVAWRSHGAVDDPGETLYAVLARVLSRAEAGTANAAGVAVGAGSSTGAA